MDWKQKLQAARHLGRKSRENIEQIAQQKIQEHWPRIQQLLQERVGPAALSAAKDDETMTSLLSSVYRRLPRPLRMVIKERTFTDFCLKNRDKLFKRE